MKRRLIGTSLPSILDTREIPWDQLQHHLYNAVLLCAQCSHGHASGDSYRSGTTSKGQQVGTILYCGRVAQRVLGRSGSRRRPNRRHWRRGRRGRRGGRGPAAAGGNGHASSSSSSSPPPPPPGAATDGAASAAATGGPAAAAVGPAVDTAPTAATGGEGSGLFWKYIMQAHHILLYTITLFPCTRIFITFGCRLRVTVHVRCMIA